VKREEAIELVIGLLSAGRRGDTAALSAFYADDAVIVAFTLRSVTRRAGSEAIERHWPGTPEGLRVVKRLAGIPTG